MIIRTAKPIDSFAIARVQIESNRTSYRGIMTDEYLDNLSFYERERFWRQRILDLDQGTIYVAEIKSEVIAYCFISNVATNKIADRELHSLYILEEHQKKGIGKEFFKTIKNKKLKNNSLMLWTLSKNPTREFYIKLGGIESVTREIVKGDQTLEQTAYLWKNADQINI